MKTLREYVTVKKAAEILGVSSLTLRRWDNKGKLISQRHPINRYRLYDRKKLVQLLKNVNG
ncbi:MAG: MerR family DNA-binding transcriptional regulator [Elusimicrobia bacterium]|nr:MerR family DNA-binding transcriptional regulator [Elusimicrobiota bacterium]